MFASSRLYGLIVLSRKGFHLVNTHYHGDHTGGNEIFGKEAPIIAHENVRKRLASGSKNPGGETPPAPKKRMLAAVDNVLSTMPDDAKVIPGHGPLSDKAGLRAFAEVLRGTSNAVAKAVAAGKTLDQMKAEKILAQWDTWGKGFIKTDAWLATLAAEAKK